MSNLLHNHLETNDDQEKKKLPREIEPQSNLLKTRKKASDFFNVDDNEKQSREDVNNPTDKIMNSSGDKMVKNVVWIGTSLSKALNKNKFERDTKTKVKFVKAFGIREEADHYYPKANVKDTVERELEVKMKLGCTRTLL